MISETQKSALYQSLFEDLKRYRLAWNERIETAALAALLNAQTKLQIINILGGCGLADELCAMFEEFDEWQAGGRHNELEMEYGDPGSFHLLNLTGAFDLAADSIIDGWYR